MPDKDQLTMEIIGGAIEVHRILGPGLLDPTCEEALNIEMRSRGIPFQRRVEADVLYEGHGIKGQRLDILVSGQVVIGVKSVAHLPEVATGQVLLHPKTNVFGRGLPINFGGSGLADGIRRIPL